jgi:hypothetical protein
MAMTSKTQGLEQYVVTRPVVTDDLDAEEQTVVIACCTSLEAADAARRLLLDELASEDSLAP